MNTWVLIRIALKSIRKNKTRTLLTMLGIIIGVAAVIVMVALGQGAKEQIRSRIDSLGSNLVVITPGASRSGGVSQGAGSMNRLTLTDAEALARESMWLSSVSPLIVAPAHAVGGSGNWRVGVSGVSADYAAIRNWDVSSGRLFDETEVRAMRKVCVLGKTVVDNLFAEQDPVGQQIILRDVPFEIIGVLEPKGQTAEGRDQDDTILAPYTTVKTRLAGRQFIPMILGATDNKADVPAALTEAKAILRETHGLASYDDDDFTVRDQNELAETAEGATEVMTLLLAAIAGVSLLVGGIGIMNIMLVSVTERTREIGIRMAVGARGGDVLLQFLIEAIVMSLFGGLIGVAAGYGGSALLEKFTGWETVITPQLVAISLGFSAAVGIFFGFYPARKAAALDPIQALRYE
ncbi:MAG: ABC transporter permease [Candidatus Delongbacteria bacterium]